MAGSDYDDDEYEVPLRDQKYFGAGLKRKRVRFVPSSSSSSSTTPAATRSPEGHSRNPYHKLLQSTDHRLEHGTPSTDSDLPLIEPAQQSDDSDTTECPICRLPLAADPRHDSSLAHQVCLPHMHPPSALDRRRKGMAMLASHGWDADRRLGLGAAGQGRLYPVVVKDKHDRHGVGAAGAGSDAGHAGSKTRPKATAKERPRNLDAGKVRARDDVERKKDQRMRDMFYRDEEIERYLHGHDDP